MCKKAYVYTRVSTAVQVDGFSLEGQIEEIKRYCKSNNIEIIEQYEDAGISGTSVNGRISFQKMLDDVKNKKEVDYVIVWKLSRFGRNACDTLNSLDVLKRNGVHLIATKDGLNSEEKLGALMIQMLSVIAEMERENIIEQTRNGKKYNALKGGWNGGQAPYGYELVEKKLVIVPEQRDVVQYIYKLFLSNDEIGYNGIVGILNEQGYKPRQVAKKSLKDHSIIPPAEDWNNSSVKRILDNPIYTGKLPYGRDRIEKQEDGSTKRIHNKQYTLVDGHHEAIIDEETWNKVKEKRNRMAVIHKRDKSTKREVKNLLSQLIICPECGNRMIATKTGGHRNKHGEMKYYHSYVCGYNNNHKGCCHKNAVKTDRIDIPVIDTLREYIQKEEFIHAVKIQLEKEVDIPCLEREIAKYKSDIELLQKKENHQYELIEKIASDSKYSCLKEDKILESIKKITEEMKGIEATLAEKEKILNATENNRLTLKKVEFAIRNFGDVFQNATKELQNELVKHFVEEIRVERDEITGKIYPKTMVIKFTGEEIDLVVENLGVKKSHVETVVLLSQQKPSDRIAVELDLDELDVTSAETKATYAEIKDYVLKEHGLKVSNLYISQVKRKCGLEVGENYNMAKSEDAKQPNCPEEKEKAIVGALKHFGMV